MKTTIVMFRRILLEIHNIKFNQNSQNCENRLLASSRLSGRQFAWKNWASTERIFMKFDILLFF